MSPELRRYGGGEVGSDAALRERLGEVYADAFGRPPHDRASRESNAWAEGTLLRHATYPGFGLVTAVRERQLLGFGYGQIGTDEQWFTQTLRTMLPVPVAADWLGESGGHGELVELAVVGSAQGQRIGGLLHDAVLAHLRASGTDRALLVTHRDAAPARALYGSRGWRVLAELEPDSVLMGIRFASV